MQGVLHRALRKHARIEHGWDELNQTKQQPERLLRRIEGRRRP